MSLLSPGRLLLISKVSVSVKARRISPPLVLSTHIRHLIASALRRSEWRHGNWWRGRRRLGIRSSHGFGMRCQQLRIDGELGSAWRIRVSWRGRRSRREAVVRVRMHVLVIIRGRPVVDHEPRRVHPGRRGRHWMLHRRRWREVRRRRRVRLRALGRLDLGRRGRARRWGGTRWGRRCRRTLDALLPEHVLQRLPHLGCRVRML
ncbi:hypothetical protein CALVIDRAFT_17768 [Calocera viscosa TUFC12733]|uniref:Uncharacterized protein n=1 Tax=Calocera viscosa (strain TUFC12733) TaxID=1330018 RepID=A0A167SCM7_CALVF|nr:hypothetical protein CALVIDRAFT_17768 [Calocera viscosa TUFC12733]